MGVVYKQYADKNGRGHPPFSDITCHLQTSRARLIEFYLKKEKEGTWTNLSKKKLPWVKASGGFIFLHPAGFGSLACRKALV